jgi:hypothetical protein
VQNSRVWGERQGLERERTNRQDAKNAKIEERKRETKRETSRRNFI